MMHILIPDALVFVAGAIFGASVFYLISRSESTHRLVGKRSFADTRCARATPQVETVEKS